MMQWKGNKAQELRFNLVKAERIKDDDYRTKNSTLKLTVPDKKSPQQYTLSPDEMRKNLIRNSIRFSSDKIGELISRDNFIAS
jgi:hypothetical protein